MRRFVLPEMPLTCRIFTGQAGWPPVGEPRVTTDCQLTYGRRVQVASTGGTTVPGILTIAMNLVLPKGTDVRGPEQAGMQDFVEVPAGTGRWYRVMAMDDIAKGFPNEHRTAVIFPVAGTWPSPAP